MVDASNHKPIRVSVDSAGPSISLPVGQLGQVRKLLEDNHVSHWVSHHAISVDGGPLIALIYLGRKTDPPHAQGLLDAMAYGGAMSVDVASTTIAKLSKP